MSFAFRPRPGGTVQIMHLLDRRHPEVWVKLQLIEKPAGSPF
jgi:hypothetical protein